MNTHTHHILTAAAEIRFYSYFFAIFRIRTYDLFTLKTDHHDDDHDDLFFRRFSHIYFSSSSFVISSVFIYVSDCNSLIGLYISQSFLFVCFFFYTFVIVAFVRMLNVKLRERRSEKERRKKVSFSIYIHSSTKKQCGCRLASIHIYPNRA